MKIWAAWAGWEKLVRGAAKAWTAVGRRGRAAAAGPGGWGPGGVVAAGGCVGGGGASEVCWASWIWGQSRAKWKMGCRGPPTSVRVALGRGTLGGGVPPAVGLGHRWIDVEVEKGPRCRGRAAAELPDGGLYPWVGFVEGRWRSLCRLVSGAIVGSRAPWEPLAGGPPMPP